MIRYNDPPAGYDPDYADALLAFDCAVLDLMNCGCSPDNVRALLADAISRGNGIEDDDA